MKIMTVNLLLGEYTAHPLTLEDPRGFWKGDEGGSQLLIHFYYISYYIK